MVGDGTSGTLVKGAGKKCILRDNQNNSGHPPPYPPKNPSWLASLSQETWPPQHTCNSRQPPPPPPLTPKPFVTHFAHSRDKPPAQSPRTPLMRTVGPEIAHFERFGELALANMGQIWLKIAFNYFEHPNWSRNNFEKIIFDHFWTHR